MNTKPHITLDIPDEEDFDPDGMRILVPELVVASTIDLLQGIMAQWRKEAEGCERDEVVWGALMAAAGHALGVLVAAHAAFLSGGSMSQVVQELGRILPCLAMDTRLEEMRTADNAFIVDGLLAMHDEAMRRYKQQQLPASGSPVARPSAHEPVPGGKKDWDF